MVNYVWLQVELILSLAALSKGLYDVVAMSLIGSVLSNLLLVLGENFSARTATADAPFSIP